MSRIWPYLGWPARGWLGRCTMRAGRCWSVWLRRRRSRRGRTVVRVGRFFPSSRLCSVCARKDGPKPLKVRVWTCPACNTEHDRDLNAARNILFEGQRMVAAGRKDAAAMPRQAETVNACGADVRPGPVRAAGRETGTHRGAA
ncbi:zinc ribbon domain-containing protein [Parafrankia soli]|uniref:zinc ribbon domain-containing protein n=1 Tax=Parafrankia soli TaxID=2599596 RepID=UPI003B84918F